MRRLIKGIGIVVAMLLVAVIGSFAWGRLRPPTPFQAESMALLKTPPRPAGSHNAWADFWLLDYEVPAAEREAAYARERRNVTAWTQQADPSRTEYRSELARRYPALPKLSEEEKEQLCRTNEKHCLAKVQQHVPALSALLTQHGKRLAKVRALESADVLWDDMPLDVIEPIPSFGRSQDLLLTDAALNFVDSHQRAALTQVCSNITTLRRLHAHTNSLLGAMVMAAWSDPAERLFADMLVRLPPDESAPAVCSQAFAPVGLADIDLCATIQRQYAGVVETIETFARQPPTGLDRFKQYLVPDASNVRRLLAPSYSWACRSDQRAAMLADRRMNRSQIPQVQPDFFDTYSNVVSTILAGTAAPAYADYANRNEDYAASLRPGRALLQAHADASNPGELREALAPRLARLNENGTRSFSIDSDGRFVRMPYYVSHAGRSGLALSIAAPVDITPAPRNPAPRSAAR